VRTSRKDGKTVDHGLEKEFEEGAAPAVEGQRRRLKKRKTFFEMLVKVDTMGLRA